MNRPTTLLFWSDIGDIKVRDPFNMITSGDDPHGLHIERAGEAAEAHQVPWAERDLLFAQPTDSGLVCSEGP